MLFLGQSVEFTEDWDTQCALPIDECPLRVTCKTNTHSINHIKDNEDRKVTSGCEIFFGNEGLSMSDVEYSVENCENDDGRVSEITVVVKPVSYYKQHGDWTCVSSGGTETLSVGLSKFFLTVVISCNTYIKGV